MKLIKYLLVIIFFQTFFSCNKLGAGSFSGWNVITFKITSNQLDEAIKSLYKIHPEYIMPSKWKSYGDDWIKQGYVKRKVYIFYFNENPEEMYYVSLVDPGYTKHPEYARFSIRGVETGNGDWKENKEYSDEEELRIEKRFKNEIISKLENYTNSKPYIE
jgi:hypothetical protein